ncbi:hypothetical protein B0H19DRAFT_1066274 [Mycena capillaripes]|nr:hypothetical protein B0H19DRAFT_1066274 [Mycena capillaripes]
MDALYPLYTSPSTRGRFQVPAARQASNHRKDKKGESLGLRNWRSFVNIVRRALHDIPELPDSQGKHPRKVLQFSTVCAGRPNHQPSVNYSVSSSLPHKPETRQENDARFPSCSLSIPVTIPCRPPSTGSVSVEVDGQRTGFLIIFSASDLVE